MLNFLQKITPFHQNSSFSATKAERDQLCETIINTSSLKPGFFLLLVLSTFIVTVGLLKNSLVLIIGGMMVAPLLSPILSLSLAITILDWRVFLRSVKTFLVSLVISLAVSYALGLISNFSLHQVEMVGLMQTVDLSALLIPIAAGIAASFTWAKKELSGSLPGVAVTVTLLPPLTIMGLALAVSDNIVFQAALRIYALNVSGIIIGSLTVFMLMGFYKSAKKLVSAVKQEESN